MVCAVTKENTRGELTLLIESIDPSLCTLRSQHDPLQDALRRINAAITCLEVLANDGRGRRPRSVSELSLTATNADGYEQ
jgi:hypothetical protein